jgi:hypothetical protein
MNGQDMSRLSKRALAIAAATMQAGVDSAVTISARTPGLLIQGFNPTAGSVRESQRMIAEKIDAAWEGAAAAQMAWASLLLKASFGGIRLANVAEAAIRPARRKVRANAKRLTAARRIG